jgi:hypothetical protein
VPAASVSNVTWVSVIIKNNRFHPPREGDRPFEIAIHPRLFDRFAGRYEQRPNFVLATISAEGFPQADADAERDSELNLRKNAAKR